MLRKIFITILLMFNLLPYTWAADNKNTSANTDTNVVNDSATSNVVLPVSTTDTANSSTTVGTTDTTSTADTTDVGSQTPVTSPNPQMSKENWLKAMEPMLPQMICKGFINDPDLKKRFDELQLTYDKCLALIPDNEKICRDRLYSEIPDNLDTKSAGTWGKKLGECIGKDFAEKNLIQK